MTELDAPFACIRDSFRLGETGCTWRGPRLIENLDKENLETSLNHRRPLIALRRHERLGSGSCVDGFTLWCD